MKWASVKLKLSTAGYRMIYSAALSFANNRQIVFFACVIGDNLTGFVKYVAVGCKICYNVYVTERLCFINPHRGRKH